MIVFKFGNFLDEKINYRTNTLEISYGTTLKRQQTGNNTEYFYGPNITQTLDYAGEYYKNAGEYFMFKGIAIYRLADFPDSPLDSTVNAIWGAIMLSSSVYMGIWVMVPASTSSHSYERWCIFKVGTNNWYNWKKIT